MTEQRAGEPIGPMLIDDAYYRHIVPDYGAAYEAAAVRVGTMSETDWNKVVRRGDSTITDGPDQGFVMIEADPTAYRTKRAFAHSPGPSGRWNRCSNQCRYKLANKGEITPPCGVP